MLDYQRENLLVSPQLSAPMAWHTADIIQATHQQIQHLIPQSCDAGGSGHCDLRTTTGLMENLWGSTVFDSQTEGSWIVNVPFCQMDFSENRVLLNWRFIVMPPWKTHLVRYLFLTHPNLRSNNKISLSHLVLQKEWLLYWGVQQGHSDWGCIGSCSGHLSPRMLHPPSRVSQYQELDSIWC